MIDSILDHYLYGLKREHCLNSITCDMNPFSGDAAEISFNIDYIKEKTIFKLSFSGLYFRGNKRINELIYNNIIVKTNDYNFGYKPTKIKCCICKEKYIKRGGKNNSKKSFIGCPTNMNMSIYHNIPSGYELKAHIAQHCTLINIHNDLVVQCKQILGKNNNSKTWERYSEGSLVGKLINLLEHFPGFFISVLKKITTIILCDKKFNENSIFRKVPKDVMKIIINLFLANELIKLRI